MSETGTSRMHTKIWNKLMFELKGFKRRDLVRN